MAEKRSRYFSLVTYITDTNRVLEMLGNKRTSIRAYALIKLSRMRTSIARESMYMPSLTYDKDSTDPHHHIVIRTHSAWTCPAVCKWFKDTETGQNTFAEFIHDREAVLDYLTHENERSEGKHIYNKADIIDGGMADLLPREDTADDGMNIVEDILAGYSTREMCKRYGREFIYRFAAYKAVAEQIREEEQPR